MNVRPCETATDTQQWDAYVTRHPQATSDHLWGWRRVLTEAFGYTPHYLGAFAADQLVGVLPLFRVPRGWGRTALSSIPFGNYGGICADSSAVAQALLEAAKALLHAQGGVYLDLRHRTPLAEASLQSPPHAHSRYVMLLGHDLEEQQRQFGANNRSKMRRAERRGLSWHITHDCDQVYAIYAHTTHRQGRPGFPRRYFELILSEFGSRARVVAVVQEQRMIAYNLCFQFQHALVAQFSGSLEESYRCYPNEYLAWSTITHAHQEGCTEFDFCRSRDESGTAAFKRKLRFTAQPLDYQYYVPNGQAPAVADPSGTMARAAINTWRRLPIAMALALGPRILRYRA